jgi:hypothetical protein
MVDININNGTDEFVIEEDEEILEISWPEEDKEIEFEGTPIFELKARREKIASELVKSFAVPRWEDPEIYCEFSIVEPSVLAKALQKRERQKNKKDDWVAWAYCDLLSSVCKRVYAVVDGDHDNVFSLRPGDPNGKPTKVDHDLARALGLDPADTNASETFRKLFFSEGDVIEFATRVFRWSSIVGEEADENF